MPEFKNFYTYAYRVFNPELNKWHWVNPNDVPKFLESGHRIGRK